MGLYSLPVGQQKQSSIFGYPRITEGLANQTMIDQFQRATLNATGFPTLYTSTITGSGTSVISQSNSWLLTTSVVIGDDVDGRMDISLNRVSRWIEMDSKQIIETDIIFQTGLATLTEGFIGMIASTTATISALPTTAAHLGLYWDKSAGANLMLTSANGTTQITTDTGLAIPASTFMRLNIKWTGTDSAVISLYSQTGSGVPFNYNTLVSSQTVTAFGSNNNHLHFFIQTEGTVARTLNIVEYRITNT